MGGDPSGAFDCRDDPDIQIDACLGRRLFRAGACADGKATSSLVNPR